jgi:glycosyltransferase involved in cell wall biosynthesis
MDEKIIKRPLVSICIPVRNGAKFIDQAVTSILGQSYQDFEVVIIDNCSIDNTVKIINEIIDRTNKIKFYKNDHNIGLIENFNACLKRASGKYIKFLCADDILLPNCLEEMVSAIEANDSASLVTGGRLLVNEKGEVLAFKNYSKSDSLIPGKNVINRCLFGANYIGEPSATMFRRGVLNDGFNINFPHLVDLEMWFRILEKGDLICISKPLCAIRRHELQMTQKNIQSDLLVEDNVRLFDMYKGKPYIKYSHIATFGREMRMAYRIWMSRKYIQNERKNQILKIQSNYFFYYLLIPLANLTLRFLRKLQYHFFSMLNARKF